MSYGNTEFLEDIMDCLDITVPGTGEYDVRECSILAMEEIDRLQMRDKMLALLDKEPETRPEKIKVAFEMIKSARKHLRAAGANNAADYVARALKSVEGAYRHARGLESREAGDGVRRM